MSVQRHFECKFCRRKPEYPKKTNNLLYQSVTNIFTLDFFVGFVLLNLQFYVKCFVEYCLPFFLIPLIGHCIVCPYCMQYIEHLSMGGNRTPTKVYQRYQRGNQKPQNRRRTDNTMAKRKRTEGETTIYKTLHRKLKIM